MGRKMIYTVYAIVFSAAVYLPEYSTFLFFILSVFNAIIWITKPRYKNVALFSVGLIGSELLTILNVLFFYFS